MLSAEVREGCPEVWGAWCALTSHPDKKSGAIRIFARFSSDLGQAPAAFRVVFARGDFEEVAAQLAVVQWQTKAVAKMKDKAE